MPPTTYTIPQVIQYAAMTQVLVDRDIRKGNFSGKQYIDKRHSRLLYMERAALSWYYTYGTNAQVLNKIGNYVFGLCGAYISEVLSIIGKLTQLPPVITGPANQSVNVGASATFGISVTSTLPYTIQWYDSFGNPIIGATGLNYIFFNSQLTDNGKTFFARVTNAAGTTTSAVATLTVTAMLSGFFYYGADFSSQLLSGSDPISYSGSFPITNGQPLVVTFPTAAENTFLVIKYPDTQPTKTQYSNLPVNIGVIPSIAFEVAAFAGWKYVFSRTGNPFALNAAQPLTLS